MEEKRYYTKTIVKAWISSCFVFVFFVILGKFDFFDRIPTEVAIYRNTPIEGSAYVNQNETLEVQFDSYSDFDKICIPVSVNENNVSIEIQLYNSVPELQSDIIFEVGDLTDSDRYPGWKELELKPNSNDDTGISEEGYYYLYLTNYGDPISVALQDSENYFEAIPEMDAGKVNIGIYKNSKLGNVLTTVIYITILFFVFIIFYLYYLKKLTVKNFYVFAGILLGIVIYMIIFPAWSTNDATVHYIAANRYANKLCMESGENEWAIRTGDVDFWDKAWKVRTSHEYPNPSLESYYSVASGLDNGVFESDVEYVPSTVAEHMLFYKLICYWPLSAGIALGRLLHFNFIICVYLGRLFAGIVSLALIFNAIRKIPFGKSILAFLALTPVALMYMTSYSYDGMVFCVCLNVIASIIQLRFDDEAWNKRNIIEGIIWAFALGGVKGGGYLVLIPMFFTLLKKPVKSKRNAFVLGAVTTSVLSVILFDVVLKTKTEFFQFGSAGGNTYTTSFAFKQPIKYLAMLIRSWIEQADYWIYGSFGTNLGWDELVVPVVIITVIIILVLVFGVMECFVSRKEIKLTRQDRVCMILSIALLVVLMPAMMMRNTPINSISILGVQGRYYLPLMPVLFIMISSAIANKIKKYVLIEKTKITEKTDEISCILGAQNNMLIIFMLISCVIVYILMRTYMTR